MLKITGSGFIGNSEFKTLGSDSGMIKFSLASSRYDSKEGKNVTDWVDCVLFGKRALSTVVQDMLSKGRFVVVDGLLNINKYERQDGSKSTSYSILINDFQVAPAGAKTGINENDLPVEQKYSSGKLEDLPTYTAGENHDDSDIPF